MQPKEIWRYWKTSKPWTQLTHRINFDANEVEPQSLSPRDPHLGQAITQIIYLHCFLSSPLHWGQKLFLLISHKWHCPAQLIIIQAPCLSWLIGMRVHWSICLRISPEAATPPSTLGSLSRAVRDRYRCADFENRCSTRAKRICSRYSEKVWGSTTSVLGSGAATLQEIVFKMTNAVVWGKHMTRVLTSPSGCKHWGHQGSDCVR